MAKKYKLRALSSTWFRKSSKWFREPGSQVRAFSWLWLREDGCLLQEPQKRLNHRVLSYCQNASSEKFISYRFCGFPLKWDLVLFSPHKESVFWADLLGHLSAKRSNLFFTKLSSFLECWFLWNKDKNIFLPSFSFIKINLAGFLF